MKKAKWNVWGDNSESLHVWATTWFRKWGQDKNERFQQWYITVPAHRMKVYLLFSGALVLILFVVLLTVGFADRKGSMFGRVNIPAHMIGDPAEGEAAARRAIRSRIQFQALIDSLKHDSSGKVLLDSLIRQGRIRLDSTLLN